MSLFERIFGSKTAHEERAEADRLFEAGDVFEARLAYERVLARARDADPELREHCERRIEACADALAEQRIAEAERLRHEGELDLARTELATAVEIARSAAVREKARRAIETLERRDAIEKAAEVPELGDDERWHIITQAWEDAQLEESDRYGEAFRRALLDLHDGEVRRARAVLEDLGREHAEHAVYLHLEIGRARLADADRQGAAEALRRFLERVYEEDRSDARLAAYLALCSLAEASGDEQGAIDWLNQAIDAMPDDPRPYVQLGAHLRVKGHPEEAIEVLETAISLLDDERPSWEAFQELGLAKMDAGRDEEAVELLERVIAFFVQRSRIDAFPRASAMALARLHEKAGRLERAADLYRSLASGQDRANHLEYHREAARVLEQLGLLPEARRMLTRAAALAENHPEVLADVERKIAEIDERL